MPKIPYFEKRFAFVHLHIGTSAQPLTAHLHIHAFYPQKCPGYGLKCVLLKVTVQHKYD